MEEFVSDILKSNPRCKIFYSGGCFFVLVCCDEEGSPVGDGRADLLGALGRALRHDLVGDPDRAVWGDEIEAEVDLASPEEQGSAVEDAVRMAQIVDLVDHGTGDQTAGPYFRPQLELGVRGHRSRAVGVDGQDGQLAVEFG